MAEWSIATLGNESGERHQPTSTRLKTHAISDLTPQKYAAILSVQPNEMFFRGFEPDVSQSYHNESC